MIEITDGVEVPASHGYHQWLYQGLPTRVEPWRLSRKALATAKPLKPALQLLSPTDQAEALLKDSLHRCVCDKPWQWPQQPIFFISDAHADAEAFIVSLIASSGLYKTGADLFDFDLTERGQQALFIIGGDCLDKGPSNLQLLRAIRQLIDRGADVQLLAGNHDMRLLMGIRCLALPRQVSQEHFFVRMGAKVVALLQEIYQEYLQPNPSYLNDIPDTETCRAKLFPRQQWSAEFRQMATGVLRQPVLEKEIKRIGEKVLDFEQACANVGLSLRDVYATALKCQQLFMHPQGEFYWFFQRMQLVYKAGSLLFLHAGVDDRFLELLASEGVNGINERFRQQLEQDLFAFYYGVLANSMRTKYRDVDMPLTEAGVNNAFAQGIHAVVHGHRSQRKGQRLMLRQGLLHVEADITLDRNSRLREGLPGYGVGVTLIQPEGKLMGISKDYPFAKVLQPEQYLQQN